jgi:periplasmic mercuric ion binding protein
MKVILGVVVSTLVFGGGYSLIAGSNVIAPATQQTSDTAKAGAATADETTGLQTVALKVDNMYCASCPIIVKRTLEGVDGVRKVDISFRKKSAVVSYDPQKCSAAQLVAATKNVGFPSAVIKPAK